MIPENLTKAVAEDYASFNPAEDKEISIFKKPIYITAGILIIVIVVGVIFGFTLYG